MVYQAKLPQKRLQYLPSERVYVGTLLKANIYIYGLSGFSLY